MIKSWRYSAIVFAAWATIVSAAPTPSDDNVYFQANNVQGTIYYDLSHNQGCEKNYGVNWSETTGMTSVNGTPPKCDTARGYNLRKLGKSNIVAFNALINNNDLPNWCGRIVKIYRDNGEEYRMSDGEPFFIWDGCENCGDKGSSVIDLSADAAMGLQDGPTDDQTGNGCGNPLKLRYEVTNEYFWRLGLGGVVDEHPDPEQFPIGAKYMEPANPTNTYPPNLPNVYQSPNPGHSVQTDRALGYLAGSKGKYASPTVAWTWSPGGRDGGTWSSVIEDSTAAGTAGGPTSSTNDGPSSALTSVSATQVSAQVVSDKGSITTPTANSSTGLTTATSPQSALENAAIPSSSSPSPASGISAPSVTPASGLLQEADNFTSTEDDGCGCDGIMYRCNGNTLETCGATDSSGRLDWLKTNDCPAGCTMTGSNPSCI